MNNIKRIIILFVSVCYCVSLYSQTVFNVELKQSKQINVNKEYENATDSIFWGNQAITDLVVSGKVELYNINSLVRIILVSNDTEYLIYQKNYFAQDSLSTSFTDNTFETINMNSVVPQYIKIVVNDAKLYIKNFSYQNVKHARGELYIKHISDIDRYLAEQWNQHNALMKYPWIADVTEVSKMSFSEKKRIFNATDDAFNTFGMEYYAAGYFVFPSINNDSVLLQNHRTQNYVQSFDWRHRHGKNWMTSVKNQHYPNNPTSGNNGCWVFGACAGLESRLNLYYNRLLDIDLSEQEIGSCSNYGGSLSGGGYPEDAYEYIRNNGIVTESCFPFYNDDNISCNDKCSDPEQTITISSHYGVSKWDNNLKHELINKGPFAAGFANGNTNHVMCLSGYGTIEEGDSIMYVPKYQTPHVAPYSIIITHDSPYIGQTYWIYKNSFGANDWNDGYYYAVFEVYSTKEYNEAPEYPTLLSTLTDADIAVTDEDNDGYYFWGLGPKPAHCPVCCPDIPDGDDSDPTVGEMDEYGNFLPYVFPYSTDTITMSQTWNTDRQSCNNIVITNHAYLSIYQSTFTMNPAAKIIIKSGAGLVITGGEIINANILVESGGLLYLQQGATLNTKGKGTIDVKLGGIFNIQSGCGIEID